MLVAATLITAPQAGATEPGDQVCTVEATDDGIRLTWTDKPRTEVIRNASGWIATPPNGQTSYAGAGTVDDGWLIRRVGVDEICSVVAPPPPEDPEVIAEPEQLPVSDTLGFHVLDIPANDGARIQGFAAVPAGEGPHPLVIMPSSWGSRDLQYIVPALKWANRGYLVVGFTARGWAGPGGGEIDIAGPATIEAASTVIDWAVSVGRADEDRIGSLGISYGAGIGLLAAAQDPRIDAVVALSTWSDLADAMYPNETVNKDGVETLLGSSDRAIFGNPVRGDLMNSIVDEYESSGTVFTGLEVADVRSPINYVDELNANGTAVLIGNAWADAIFAPSGAIELFGELDGPKKLLLSPGDHAGPEATSLLGLPNERIDDAYNWMQQHVRGVDTNTGPTVEVITNDLDRKRLSAASFAGLSNSVSTLHLTKPRETRIGWWTVAPKHGELQSRASTGWSTSIQGGKSTVADSRFAVVPGIATGYLQAWLGISPTIIPATIDRSAAAVWETPRYWDSRIVAGSPSLSVTVTPSEADTTFHVYLYEKNAAEIATLITHKPYTIRDATPGVGVDVTVDLEPTMWELEPGSRLYLVIDTVDPRYNGATTGGTVQFSSPNGKAATLQVPFH